MGITPLLHNLSFSHVAGVAIATLPYLSARKVGNLIRCQLDKRRRVLRPKSHPFEAIIDITTNCNLRCPYCPTGCRRDNGRTRKMVEKDSVTRLADEVGDYLMSAVLFNWGEPLLHPHIADIVEIFHSRNVMTMLSSNLSLSNPKTLLPACDAGLDYLIVSVSGATQRTYEQYHVTGQLSNVWENVAKVLEHKKKTGRKRPLVEIKYLAFKHNLHELEEARRQAGAAGVDIFQEVKGGGPDEKIIEPRQDASNGPDRPPLCDFLWQSVVLTPDDGLSPCCLLYFKEDDFAKYEGGLDKSLKEGDFLMARRLFKPSSVNELPPDLAHACLKCDMVHKQPHLKGYLESNRNALRTHRTGGP